MSVAGTGRAESLTMLDDLCQVLQLTGKLSESAELNRELEARRNRPADATSLTPPKISK